MARKKYRFRPDPTGAGIWNKLYITPQQRKIALKWGLYGLICLVCLILQDAVLGRVRLFGGYVDLAPAAIILKMQISKKSLQKDNIHIKYLKKD